MSLHEYTTRTNRTPVFVWVPQQMKTTLCLRIIEHIVTHSL